MAADPFSLEGKRVLVTGASSGIGRQVAISCAEMGASIVVSGRNAERLQETFDSLDGEGHAQVVADLSVQQDIDSLVANAGVLNGVVHAAGFSKLVPFRLVSRQQVEESFNSNVFAPILLTKGLVAKKQIADGGSIVFVSAVASHTGPPVSVAYASTKGALLGAMRSMGTDLAKRGIRVNAVAPGYVQTPLLDGLKQTGGNMSELVEMAPLGLGDPTDIAYSVIYFLSDASRWVTRDYFIVDGGLTVPVDIYA